MKGYFKVEVDVYTYQGLVPDIWTFEQHKKFPCIFLSEDFTHYLCKGLKLIGVKSTIGYQRFKGFRTYHILDKDQVVEKVRATRLARKLVKDVLKDDGEWLYIFNRRLRLG